MAENKQFTSDIHRIFDNDEEIACADTMGDAEILVDLLNEQEERIRELEKENKQLQIEVLGQSEEIEILFDENKRLKQGKYIYGIRGGSNDRK